MKYKRLTESEVMQLSMMVRYIDRPWVKLIYAPESVYELSPISRGFDATFEVLSPWLTEMLERLEIGQSPESMYWDVRRSEKFNITVSVNKFGGFFRSAFYANLTIVNPENQQYCMIGAFGGKTPESIIQNISKYFDSFDAGLIFESSLEAVNRYI
jgi:hypothetical protein